MRTVGCEMLNSLGYEVITADNGYEAVSLFRKQRDLEFVMLDLAMPRMDGEECFREMRRLNPSAKVIMTSGYSEQEISGRLGDRGLAGFLQKPYRLGSLKEVLRRVLGEPGGPGAVSQPDLSGQPGVYPLRWYSRCSASTMRKRAWPAMPTVSESPRKNRPSGRKAAWKRCRRRAWQSPFR